MSTERKARPWHIRTGIVSALAMALLTIMTGCATPESRIKKHPEMFSVFPPEVQERVRLGEIRVGDTSDMVYIALGHPDRVYTRRTSNASVEVWAFSGHNYRHDYRPVRARVAYHDSDGRLRHGYQTDWVRVEWTEEYEALRVEFLDGSATAIEALKH
ncbi:MAG: hypothetical protein O2901_00650 [Verrucomicrobia bacterium]|nr:hypothetical protein [Verrucomicrobiota bacterium]